VIHREGAKDTSQWQRSCCALTQGVTLGT
jgi:hypothetical protein